MDVVQKAVSGTNTGKQKIERMKENADAADVVLTAEEVNALDDALNAMEMSEVFGGTKIKCS